MRFSRLLSIAISLLLLGLPTLAADAPESGEVFVSEVVVPYSLEIDLSQLPIVRSWQPGDAIHVIPEDSWGEAGMAPDPDWVDPVRQTEMPEGPHPPSTITATFAGLGFTGFSPPDTVGDVGPNHYIQMVNASRVQIWDKTGTTLAGPFDLDSLWPGGGSNQCAFGLGDPIVQYDELANRWLISEFSGSGNWMCVYISQTADPVAGGWWAYEFQAAAFPDYPKYGVWPDAYYVSTFESGFGALGIYAMDRTQMLAGAAATMQRFSVPMLTGTSSRVTRILPADHDGSAAPPVSSPGLFVRSVDATQDSSNPTDRLEVFEFVVDFVTPANSSLTQAPDVSTAPFTLLPCSPGTRDCIPQPGTSEKIDALFNRAMRRLAYRNFGTHESMVVTQVVDAGGGVAGKRWWEMRRSGGPWSVYQEGTFSPDSVYRFMGSAAMNANGDIALGYSVSDGTSVVPGIRATGRLGVQPPGTMGVPEFEIHSGVGVQTATHNRWGDYSSMNVDPADGLTFWYTQQYIQANGQWTLHIAAFTFGTDIFDDGFESGTTSVWTIQP